MGFSQLYRLRDAVTLRGEHAGFNPYDDLVIVVTEPSADLQVTTYTAAFRTAVLNLARPPCYFVKESAG